MPRVLSFRRQAPIAALYLALAIMLTQVHAYEINFGPKQELREARHDRIIEGRGEAPWAHRLLTPYLAEALARPLEPALGHRLAREGAYLSLQCAAIFCFLVFFHAFLQAWLDSGWALAGTLFAAALHPVTFRFYWFQPDSAVDLAVWAAAAWLTVARRDVWLAPLTAIGALNRETAVFVAVIFLALRWGDSPRSHTIKRFLGLLLAWLIPFLALHAAVGMRPWAVNLHDLVRSNLQPSWLLYAVAFLAPLLLLPWIGWSRRPPELRRLAVALLVTYLPLQLVFGRIREVRLFLPLAIPLIPLVLLALRDSANERSDER
jgi:hypothetical protein